MTAPPVPNSVDISPDGASLIASSTVVVFLAIVAVALRFWSRGMGSRYGPDDWTILLGLFLVACLYSTSVTINTVGYGGFQQSELTASQLERSLLLIYIDDIIYALTLPTIKCSILLLYRRIFPVPIFRRVVLIVGILVMGWMISTMLAQIFSCTPVEGSWKPQFAQHCINFRAFYFGNAISNLLLDVIILCLPMPMVWNLQMSLHRKISVCGTFLLGGFVCICSVLRIVYLGRIDPKNATYTEASAAIWTNVEPCIGIVCACLPTLPSLVRIWYQNIKSLTGSRSKHTAAGADSHNNRGSQRAKLRETAERDLHSEYEELDDAGSIKARHNPIYREGGDFIETHIALQPIEVRQDV